MKIKVSREELGFALDKLCRLTSSSPEDGQSYELKISARKGSMAIEATNTSNTISAIYLFSEDAIEAEDKCEFCIPASPLQDTVNLFHGDEISFDIRAGEITISASGGSDDDEHTLAGMAPSDWKGVPNFKDANATFDITREAIVGLPRFEGFCCSKDPGMAPLTAIHVKVNSDGSVVATSSDMARVSFLDLGNAVTNFNSEKNECEFMMPPDSSKILVNMFGNETAEISVKLDDKRVSLSSGPLTVYVLTEIAVGGYPVLSDLRTKKTGFIWQVDLAELQRIVRLVAIVAKKTSCKIKFLKSGKISISGSGSINKGSRSRQTMDAINTDGELLSDSTMNEIDVVCIDLVDVLNVPTSDQIGIGLSMTNNETLGPVFVLEQNGKIDWNHVMFRAVAID